MEEITLEWLAEVAPEMLDVEDSKPGEYMKLSRGIEVGGGGCYLMCCKHYVENKWVPIPEVELHYVVGADYNYEGSTSLDHVTTRDEFRQLVRLLTGREIR
jgi:hypothetical protein